MRTQTATGITFRTTMAIGLAFGSAFFAFAACGTIPDVKFVESGEGGSADDGASDVEIDQAPTFCGGELLPAGGTCCEGIACVGICSNAPRCKEDCLGAACCGPLVCCRTSNGAKSDVRCVTPGLEPCP
jgi:hypothetical protein